MNRISYAALAAVLVILDPSCSFNRDAAKQSYLESGNHLFESGDWEEASLNYRKAIQRDSRFGEAYFKLGLAEARRGDPVESTTALLRANKLMPQRDDVKIALADSSLALFLRDRSWSAHEEAAQTIAQISHQNSYDALRLRGMLAIVNGEIDSAREYFRRANALRPMQPDLVHAFAQTLLQGSATEAAQGEALARELIEMQPTFLPGYDVLYGRYITTHRSIDAERLLLDKIRNNPADSASLAQLAVHYSSVGNPTAMRATVDRLLANDGFPDRFLRVGDLYRSINQSELALAMYKQGRETQPTNALLYEIRIIATLQMEGKWQDALEELNSASASHPDDLTLSFLKAQILAEAGGKDDLEQSRKILIGLLKKEDQAQFHNLLGKIYLKQGNRESAEKQFVIAANQSGYLDPLRSLCQLRLEHKDYRRALQYADSLLRISPTDPDARLLHAVALRGQGNFAQAETELTFLAKQFPKAPEPRLELANLRLVEGQYNTAETLFEGIDPGSGDLRSIEGLARTYFDEKRNEKAIKLLREYAAPASAPPGLHLLLADAAFVTRDFPLAVQQYTLAAATEPESAYVHLRWGDALLQSGRVSEAIQQLQIAYDISPEHTPVAALLALAYEQAARKKDAIAMYREVLKADPDNIFVLNNLAFALSEADGDLNEALALAERAQRQAPADPRISDTVGWVYLKKRNVDAAVQVFSNDVRLMPRNPVFRYHLALALNEKGDRPSAAENLKIALKEKPNGADAQNMRTLLSRLGSP